jgi:hypothetical protein
MTVTTTKRPTRAARRLGYTVSIGINAMLLYATNVWPGWDALPFLTSDTELVIGLVNASIIVNLAANVVYLLRDPPWLRALGDILTLSVGLVAMAQIWLVFPFDFSGSTFDWTLVARILLGVGIVGSVIGILAAMVSFVKALAARSA